MDTTLRRDRLREFVDLIVSSLDEEIDGAEIAARGYLSRFHFDRLIAAAIGESPGAFRRRLLLERAAWQLCSSRSSITRVAFDAGYRSTEAFTRAFGRAFDVTPHRYRAAGCAEFRIEAPNGVHFLPPGRIAVPGAPERSRKMDFVDRIVDHDVWFTMRLLDRAAALPTEALDKPVMYGWGWGPGGATGRSTLRAILNEMVANKENWTASLDGETPPDESDTSVEGMQRRYRAVAPQWKARIARIRDMSDWNAGFVDALCDPPESFTYGGMLAHVTTFSAFRRTMAVLALRELGVDDIGPGDPISWEREQA